MLYNGELGVYSVVNFVFELDKRSGQIKPGATILTAEVPLRTMSWTIFEGMVALFSLRIVLGEVGEVIGSFSAMFGACRREGNEHGCVTGFTSGAGVCCNEHSYFRDPWNVLDWSVVFIFVIQALIWYLLEFVWLPSDYAILGAVPAADQIKAANHTVTQDDFIEIITSMTEHSGMADLVLKLGAINCILLLIRFIKMARLHPKTAFLTQTIVESAETMMPFGVLFLMFMTAFAYAGVLLFGQKNQDFITIMFAILKMWNMLLGDFDTEMYMDGEEFDWFKVAWFLLFFVVGFYILLNMLLAIIMDAYESVKENQQDDAPSLADDYAALFQWLWRAMGCCCGYNNDFYNTMADVVDVEALRRIEDAYRATPPHEVVGKFTRAFEYNHEVDPEMRRRLLVGSFERQQADEMWVTRLVEALQNCTEILAHSEDAEESPERQLLEVRERICELALLKVYDEHMKEASRAMLQKRLDRWWEEFCPDCFEDDEWDGWCEHQHDSEYDDDVEKCMPSQLLKQCIEKLNESGLEELLQTPASLNVAETQPGQMSLTALTAEEEEPGMSVQSLLDIGESEATLLWDATEQEDFEREDFEEDRCHQHDAQ